MKEICLIGHSFIRRLWEHVDTTRGLDWDFGLESVRKEWLGVGSMRLACLIEIGQDFVLDYCPDIVVLHAIDNDLNGCTSAMHLVLGHLDLTEKLATQMGRYKWPSVPYCIDGTHAFSPCWNIT